MCIPENQFGSLAMGTQGMVAAMQDGREAEEVRPGWDRVMDIDAGGRSSLAVACEHLLSV